jgi:hypothetical protein
LLGLVSQAAHAGSAIELPYPVAFGTVPAATYSGSGRVVGSSTMTADLLPDGRVRLAVQTGIEGGASMRASALLAPVEGRRALRVLEQQSESRDESGKSLGLLRIDHTRGIASCTLEGETEELVLGEDERVANVLLNLLFQPLATTPQQEIDFQVFFCRGGPRVVDFMASRVETAPGSALAEIHYQPDLGGFINWAAAVLIPKLSFWLDGEGNYVAHRIPLYSSGPEVLVVRDGLSPGSFAAQVSPK